MTDSIEANKRHWAERTRAHFAPGGWDREGFVAGRTGALHSLIVDEVGPVEGRDLLHLQCHFGADTLSWARLGARVTGVDFDPTAIAAARRLAEEVGHPEAVFVEADVLRPLDLGREFDVVFVSHGALCWLPSLDEWAATIGRHLRPGGFFYLFEFHPVAWALGDDTAEGHVTLGYPYFRQDAPFVVAGGRDYFNAEVRLEAAEHTWNHGLGEIFTALSGAGLRLDWLHEWPFCAAPIVDAMVPGDGRWFRLPGTDDYPLAYSLRATTAG